MSPFVFVILSLLSAAPKGNSGVDMCLFMSGAGRNMNGVLRKAGQLADEGRYSEALEAFWAEAERLSAETERRFFKKAEGLKSAREFLDKYVGEKDSTLRIRKDRLTFPAETWSWAAWVACRAGAPSKGLVLLKSGWRDWGDRSLLADAAFLSLASGEDPTPFVAREPVTGPEMIAKGAWFCRKGFVTKGRELLNNSMAKVLDQAAREALAKLMEECKVEGSMKEGGAP